jgi:hypothetical protein
MNSSRLFATTKRYFHLQDNQSRIPNPLLAADRSCDFILFARTPNLNERHEGPVARTATLRIVAELKGYTMPVWLPLLAYVLHKDAYPSHSLDVRAAELRLFEQGALLHRYRCPSYRLSRTRCGR